MLFPLFFITFDDPEADRKLIGTNKLARKTIGFQLRELTDIFFFGNFCNSLTIQRPQFLLRLS